MRQCRLGQYQEDTKSGKTIVAIQVTSDEKDGASALILLPLGLQLGKGVEIKLDDALPMEKAAFAICLAVGCLVPVHLSAMSVEAVEHAGKLQILQAAYGSNKPILFYVRPNFTGHCGFAVHHQCLAEDIGRLVRQYFPDGVLPPRGFLT